MRNDEKTPVNVFLPGAVESLDTGKLLYEQIKEKIKSRPVDEEDVEEMIQELQTEQTLELYYNELEESLPEPNISFLFTTKRLTEDAGLDTLKDLRNLGDFLPARAHDPELLG